MYAQKRKSLFSMDIMGYIFDRKQMKSGQIPYLNVNLISNMSLQFQPKILFIPINPTDSLTSVSKSLLHCQLAKSSL